MILECQKEKKKELPKLYQKIRFTWVWFFFSTGEGVPFSL